MKRDSTHKKRNVIFAAVILAVVFCVTSIAMIPLIRLLSSEEGQAIILQKMQTFGIFAPILFVLLQVAQVVIAVIPGGPACSLERGLDCCFLWWAFSLEQLLSTIWCRSLAVLLSLCSFRKIKCKSMHILQPKRSSKFWYLPYSFCRDFRKMH